MDKDKARYSNYNNFSYIYNRYWGGHTSVTLFPQIKNLFLSRLPPGSKILDLCCGTGKLASKLSEEDYDVWALDGSDELLVYARKDAPDVTFVLDDARYFSLPVQFGLIVSVFDSLNHILSLEELNMVFQRVYASLVPNGDFFFDLNTEKQYLNLWNGTYFSIIEDDHVCAIRNTYNIKNKRATLNATTFRKEQAWNRSDVIVNQKCYSVPDIRQCLIDNGFKDIVTRDLEMNMIENDETTRIFFSCRK